MYRYILIPTDGSETAQKALAAGIDYAREAGARVLFFTAVPEYHVPSEAELMAKHHVKSIFEHEEESREAARAILERAADSARDAHVEHETDYALSDRPYQAIIEAARKHGCDAIFMASHGRKGLQALWYGSQTKEVLTHSDIPTLVYR
ncbi:MAG TPA: universal stress protein [Burkholderiales bacterium]